jgi:hypothetical protein
MRCRPFRARVFRAFSLFASLPSCLVALTIGLHPILWDVAPLGLWYSVLFTLCLSAYVPCYLNDRASPYHMRCRPFRARVFRAFSLFASLPSCLVALTIGLHPILGDVAPSGLEYFVLFYSLPCCLNDRASPYPRGCRPFRARVFRAFHSLPLCLSALLPIRCHPFKARVFRAFLLFAFVPRCLYASFTPPIICQDRT